MSPNRHLSQGIRHPHTSAATNVISPSNVTRRRWLKYLDGTMRQLGGSHSSWLRLNEALRVLAYLHTYLLHTSLYLTLPFQICIPMPMDASVAERRTNMSHPSPSIPCPAGTAWEGSPKESVSRNSSYLSYHTFQTPLDARCHSPAGQAALTA